MNRLLRYLPIIAAVALLALCAIALRRAWPDPAKSQTIAAAGNLFAALFLAIITWVYVVTNQDTLRLMREQWNESRRVDMRFGVIAENNSAVIWVANLGLSHFMISGARIRTETLSKLLREHVVVQPGSVLKIPVLQVVIDELHLTGDFDVVLNYHGPGQIHEPPRISAPQAFNATLASGGLIANVREGFHELRQIHCPRCKCENQLFMLPDGLSDEDEVRSRKQRVEGVMRLTCPNHESEWLKKEVAVANTVA